MLVATVLLPLVAMLSAGGLTLAAFIVFGLFGVLAWRSLRKQLSKIQDPTEKSGRPRS